MQFSIRQDTIAGSRAPQGARIFVRLAVLALVIAGATLLQPQNLPGIYFIKQDLPILCLMAIATLVFPLIRFGPQWQSAPAVSVRTALGCAAALMATGILGHWAVMWGYDLSRDEFMASFAARQIMQGTLVTPVPAELYEFGRAMFPIFYDTRFDPGEAWVSGYLPVNSAIRAVVGTIAHPALANPLLFVIGLAATWAVARRIWPERADAAILATALAATSTQLIVTSMTSYAMVGHFALNMVWLALFLRHDRWAIAAAIAVAFLASGLHQPHFHLLFAGPFVLWAAYRREWLRAGVFAAAYALIAVFWVKLYPVLLLPEAVGTVAPATEQVGGSLVDYVLAKAGRLFEYPPSIWVLNFARFVAWQNILLVPLVLASLPLLRKRALWKDTPLAPLAGACAIGLALMLYQGHGWGYRYLAGLIGPFCLIAAFGWVRLVPEAGNGRHWTMLKAACLMALAVQLPIQSFMAHNFVAPYAKLHRAALAQDVDTVLIDPRQAMFAQDIAQNGPDFGTKPAIMDLSLVPDAALPALCEGRVALIDRAHFEAVDMPSTPVPAGFDAALARKRQVLDRLECAPRLPLD